MRFSTVDHVVIALGGTTAAAKVAGVVPGAICNWRERGKIPAAYIRKFEKAVGRRLPDRLFGILPATEPAVDPVVTP